MTNTEDERMSIGNLFCRRQGVADHFDTSAADGQEEEIAALDERLDSFFDLEEDVVQPEEKISLSAEPEATEDIISAEEQIAPPGFDDIEEEVVFELVEEELNRLDLADTKIPHMSI